MNIFMSVCGEFPKNPYGFLLGDVKIKYDISIHLNIHFHEYVINYKLYGSRHRLNAPAVEWSDGSEKWYMIGKRHRLDGPAIKWGTSGNKYWVVHGQAHRINGPAVEYHSSGKQWFVKNKRHRLNGPAIEFSDGVRREWYVDDVKYSEEEWKLKI